MISVGAVNGLNPVVKNVAYTVNPGELVLANATSAFTVTLPATPAANTIVAIKKTDSSTNAVTIAPGGNTLDAASPTTLTARGQTVILQYDGTGTWQLTGTTPNITVGTTTTGTAGSNASVAVTGTAAAPILSFTVPAGAAGATGATGATGTTGTTGATGPGVPTGGTVGQVLTKNSLTSYDASWATPTSGSSGVAESAYGLTFTSGSWYSRRAFVIGAARDQVTASSTIYYVPFFCPAATTFDSALIGINSGPSAAGCVCRLGVFSAASTGVPGTLVADLGTKTIATGSAFLVTWTGISVTLQKGWYWTALSFNSSPAPVGVMGTNVTDMRRPVSGLPNAVMNISTLNLEGPVYYTQAGNATAAAFGTVGTTVAVPVANYTDYAAALVWLRAA